MEFWKSVYQSSSCSFGCVCPHCSVSVSLLYRCFLEETSKEVGILPCMGYIGLCCCELGYGFWGSQSLSRVSFFPLFTLIAYIVCPPDRVHTWIVSTDVAVHNGKEVLRFLMLLNLQCHGSEIQLTLLCGF